MDATDPATILAGDIGGTNARFALARQRDGRIDFVRQRILPVSEFPGPAEAIAEFLSDAKPPAHACFAWAGPIDGTRARLTNGAWTIDTSKLAQRLAGCNVVLVNDFYAAAFGVDQLAPSDLATLQPGAAEAAGARLVIGAGTGLGVAYALRDKRGTRIVAGEGGHIGFAPQDDEQIALLTHCRAEVGRVIVEHLVSGSGIVRIYAFCCATAAQAMPEDVATRGAAAVVERADAGEPAAVRALRLFCSIYGAVAGDHALSCLATGGVFLAGGIGARLARWMADGTFLRAFDDKGVHSGLVARMPVHLVHDDLLGLKGAAALALAKGSAGRRV